MRARRHTIPALAVALFAISAKEATSAKRITVDVERLRSEVREKYAEVAESPGKRFHFHTGYRLAEDTGLSARHGHRHLPERPWPVSPAPEAPARARRRWRMKGPSASPSAPGYRPGRTRRLVSSRLLHVRCCQRLYLYHTPRAPKARWTTSGKAGCT